MQFYRENSEEITIAFLGAALVVITPRALLVPHYARATLQNLWLDLRYLGLVGTLKHRADLTPSR